MVKLRRLAIPVAVSVMVGASLLSTGACTAIVSGESVQCHTDSDCQSKGGDFALSVCTDNLCVGNCITTADCVARDGEDSFFSDAGATAYKSLLSTLDGGGVPASICVRHTCQRLRDDQGLCADDPNQQLIFGDPTATDPIVIGLMAEVTQATPPIAAPATYFFNERYYMPSAGLALNEFQNGLNSGAQFSVPGRSLLLVGCRQTTDTANPSTAQIAQHLVDLGAKVILGPQREDALPLAQQVAFPANVAVISPWSLQLSGSASGVANATALSFSTGIVADDVLKPLNAALALQIAKIQAVKGSSYKVKVATWFNITPGSFASYTSFPDALLNGLTFNGQAAVQNEGASGCRGTGGCYEAFVYDGSGTALPTDEAAKVVAFQPDIIIPFTAVEWSAAFPYIEANWGTTSGDRPIYIHPLLNFNDTSYTGATIAHDEAALERYTGIRPRRSVAYDSFEKDFEEATAGNFAYLNPGAARSYESMMLAIYGIYAAGAKAGAGNDFTGLDVAAGIRSVTTTNALAVQATTADFQKATFTLSEQKPIQYQGLVSTMVFDSTNHAPVTWESWCLDPANPQATDYTTNRTFDGTTYGAPSTTCAAVDKASGAGTGSSNTDGGASDGGDAGDGGMHDGG